MRATRVGVLSVSGLLAFATAASLLLVVEAVGDRSGGDGRARADRSSGESSAEPATGDRGGAAAARSTCNRWVSPTGDDGAPGSKGAPWATLERAVKAVPGSGCTVWFEDGVYRGIDEIERRFHERTVFRAVNDYGAILQSAHMVLDIGGAASLMTFRGFQIRQAVNGSSVAVYVSGDEATEPAPNRITFMDNIIHDTFDEDLMKIRSRAHAITVRGNIFYNQGSNEQHIDVNSVRNVVIEENVFFNAFAASERPADGTTKHFIVVKDSNESDDGLRGSERVTIQRNVFLNWQGGKESFVGIGNDGKPYHEAAHVRIQSNLMLGNSSADVAAPLTLFGARDVIVVNNTITGNLPADSYAFEVDIKGRNPRNREIRFRNNIWADPTGTMGPFSDGHRASTLGLVLDNNLYWNGGRRIPGGDLLSPMRHDGRRVLRDPLLSTDHAGIVAPVWDGTAFLSGSARIRDEFVRLVEAYGAIPVQSPAVGRALAASAPARDILGRLRGDDPDLGAFEAQAA